MSRLFIGNFSFEQGWNAGSNVTRQVLQLEAELACIWLAVAEPGDEILCPQEFGRHYWSRMQDLGCARIRPIRPDQLGDSRADRIVPWGWTPAIRKISRQRKIPIDAPDQETVWQANSRLFASNLCAKLKCQLTGEGIGSTLDEVLQLIEFHVQHQQAWIVKPNQGQAGRGQMRGMTLPAGKELVTLSRLLERQGVLHVEPFLSREMEFGGQWEIPLQGVPRFLGLTQLFTDERGVYRGTGIPPHSLLTEQLQQTLIETQMQAAIHLQSAGYFGPAGIDAMLFQSENGRQVRAIQDINARWTMGRIAWEWSRRLARIMAPAEDSGMSSGNSGIWQQTATTPAAHSLALSPTELGGLSVKNRTWWTFSTKMPPSSC